MLDLCAFIGLDFDHILGGLFADGVRILRSGRVGQLNIVDLYLFAILEVFVVTAHLLHRLARN